ncbi:hypothetical protein MMC12_006929 [Toensbergia leucococca]|nr:hypothetical protein [Toensbergia leucococca]
MSSNELQIGAWQNNSPGFVQNGQVDWVAFGNTLWSTSSAVLQRFASAGVQPVTYGAGLALASQFQLDRVGKQRMHDALTNLQGASGFGKVLWFGFGVRSFVRVMADTQLGVNCVGLCSTLTEVHSEDVAAWILEELWNLYGYPQQYLPSHAQFIALVKACSGVLTKTPFSQATGSMLGHTLDAGDTLPWISNPEDVAKAIRGLFQISNGTVSRISVVGGMECAFIAALASWFFNFKVYVEDEDGRVVYKDAPQEFAQVVVTYRRESDLCLVQVSSTTYVLHEVENLFTRNPKLDQMCLSLRTPWNGCLARVFGAAFSDLINLPYILGGFLGSTARVYSGLAAGESEIANLSRETYMNFFESSYGRGFVNATISIFPELEGSVGLFGEMQKAADVSLKEALRTIEQTMHNLAHACRCFNCTFHGNKSEKSCLLVMAISIRAMVSTISCTIRDPDLLPTIRGIRCLYNNVGNQQTAAMFGSGVTLLTVALGLIQDNMHGDIITTYRKVDVMSHAIEIFSGYSQHDRYYPESDVLERDVCTAVVRNGMCYYLDCLRSLSSRAETARIVHILPGHIHMGDRQFNVVCDPAITNTSTSLAQIQYEMVEEHDSAELEKPRWENIKIEAFGLERSIDGELVVYYQASIPGEPPLKLRPGFVTYQVLKQTGRLTCEQTHCTTQLAFPCALIQQGWELADSQLAETRTGSEMKYICCIWPQMSDIARCVVIHQNASSGRPILFLRRRECVPCCTVNVLCQRASPTGMKERYHIL